MISAFAQARVVPLVAGVGAAETRMGHNRAHTPRREGRNPVYCVLPWRPPRVQLLSQQAKQAPQQAGWRSRGGGCP